MSDPKCRILCVDDHFDTSEMLQVLLSESDYAVQTAGTMEEACALAAKSTFDLYVLDKRLPDGTGMDLMMQLRAISNVPGIAISGFGNNSDIKRSLQAGFSEHLIKPIKLEKLEAAIERAIAG